MSGKQKQLFKTKIVHGKAGPGKLFEEEFVTNDGPEAIVDKAKKKGLPEYQHLMQQCFEEYHRVLKFGRWMTVVFHNSRNAVWNAIQEAMLAAGFVVADVRTLDKK